MQPDTIYFRCFSTLGCPDFDLRRACELAAEYCVPSLELRVLEGRMDLPSYFREQDTEAVHNVLKQYGIKLASLDSSVRLLGSSPADFAELVEFGALAERLSIPWIRVFDGGNPSAPPATDAEFANAVALVEAWEVERKRRGWNVDMIVETHDAFVTAPPLLALERLLGGRLGVLWDSHHTWRKGGEPIDDTWAAIRPYVRHIHVKDSMPCPAETKPYANVLPGRGEFPFVELEALLVRDHYEGGVSLEWEKNWHPALPPLREALKCWMATTRPFR